MNRIKITICIFFLGNVFTVFSQINKDSLLVNERALDRPLNVHSGQLRINAGHAFQYLSKRFDGNQTKVNLNESGLSYGLNILNLDILYGITEYLQLKLNVRNENALQRETQIQLIGYPDNTATLVNSTNNYRGFNDVLTQIDYRLPFTKQKLDIVLTFGLFLPVSENTEKQPEHSFENMGDYWELNYRNRFGVGTGTASIKYGGNLKYRFKNVGFTISAFKKQVLNETEGKKWNALLLESGSFEYTSSTYKYKPQDLYYYSFISEIQASPYFNLFISANYLASLNGWYHEGDQAYNSNNTAILNTGGGFELIITPKIWLKESISYPVLGKTIDGGLQFFTSLQYNLFVRK